MVFPRVIRPAAGAVKIVHDTTVFRLSAADQIGIFAL
jgi:hypothetical protein